MAFAVGVLASGLLALELIRPVHLVDDGLRAAVETVILAAALVAARLLLESGDGGRRARESLLALGVLTLSIADFADWAGPVLAGDRTAAAAVHSVEVGTDLLSAAVLLLGALAFATRPRPMEPGQLLAGAALLLAAAAVQFVVVPTVPVDWVTPREGARLMAFVLLLGGAYARYANVQRRRAYGSIRSERERVAWDLHDGLAQDLAWITTEAQRLDCYLDPQHPLMLATRDALNELRRMIADLTASTAATSEEAVALVARELGRRLDLDVDVTAELDEGSAGDGGQDLRARDDLIRSTREAITRAAARGDARAVEVAVSRRAGQVIVQVSSGARLPQRPVGKPAHGRRARRVSRLSAEWSRRAGRPSERLQM